MTQTDSCPTVFIVEDEKKIAFVLRDYLLQAGYRVEVFHDGATVVDRVREDPPAALVLDLMLPGRDGMSICQELRTFSAAPILMLTARIEERDRLTGLDGGADDYVCKPFSPKEVVARINALVRRSEGRVTTDQAANRPFAVDERSRRVAWRGRWLTLSPAEFVVASTMMKQPGRVFSRDQLLDRLGERSGESSDRAIDSHMKNIRKKIAVVDPTAKCFNAEYGVGYRFDP